MTPVLPTPLVPAEVDLRDFQYMELDVRVLRDSRFAAQVTGDAFRAGVLLWCAAWHQVPAGSLPDDDIELANLAGYGRFTKEWKKVREEALTKFVKCSDGRLYHEEVSEKANAAWHAKLVHHFERARDRLRKANKARATENKPPLPEISFEQWNAQRLAGNLPMEKADASAGIPQNDPPAAPGIPPENGLKENGEGTERRRNGDSNSVPTGTADPSATDPLGDPPEAGKKPKVLTPEQQAKAAMWASAVQLLGSQGVKEPQARKFVGDLNNEFPGGLIVPQAIADAVREQPVEAKAWIKARCQALAGLRQPAELPSTRAAREAADILTGGRHRAAAPGTNVIEEADHAAPLLAQ